MDHVEKLSCLVLGYSCQMDVSTGEINKNQAKKVLIKNFILLSLQMESQDRWHKQGGTTQICRQYFLSVPQNTFMDSLRSYEVQ